MCIFFWFFREEFLLRNDLDDADAAREHELQFERRPRHALAVSDLHFKFASYSATVRLFKRCGCRG